MIDKGFFTGNGQRTAIIGDESAVALTYGDNVIMRVDYIENFVRFTPTENDSVISRKITQVCCLLNLPFQSYLVGGELFIQDMEFGMSYSDFPMKIYMP